MLEMYGVYGVNFRLSNHGVNDQGGHGVL